MGSFNNIVIGGRIFFVGIIFKDWFVMFSGSMLWL